MNRFVDRPTLDRHQLTELRGLLAAAAAANPFYRAKLAGVSPELASASLLAFRELVPFTQKEEISRDHRDFPPYGTNLTYPLHRYTRCHQTSGSVGAPIRWLDTPESWDWMLGNWERVFEAAGVTGADRAFFAFSFGPFLGFWTAFEAATRLGCLSIPGGGLSSAARLRILMDQQATLLCCTPTYALHLGETAIKEGIPLGESAVRRIIVAGEPGGSIPATRKRIEELWPHARLFDHHGMTEVGPVSYECPSHPGRLHVIEGSYIAEVIDPGTTDPTPPGGVGELVLTTLGRTGSPLIRYRTQDLVEPGPPGLCDCGSFDLQLRGGILGRTDDMVVVRGVNVYPNAVEEAIHRVGGIAEYQVRLHREGSMTELSVQVEPLRECPDPLALKARLQKEFQDFFALRIEVEVVPPGRLPRFELKARRWRRE